MHRVSLFLAVCFVAVAAVLAAPHRLDSNNKRNDAAIAQLTPEDIRSILSGGAEAGRRQQLIKVIAEIVKAKAGDCPKSLPAEMCKQPLTFFMWLNEVRNQAKEKEMTGAIRRVLVQLLAGKGTQTVDE